MGNSKMVEKNMINSRSNGIHKLNHDFRSQPAFSGNLNQNLHSESMQINRKLSSLVLVINRLYRSKAQDAGINLSLKIQSETEIQLTPEFFINLTLITGHLVANALKISPFNGSVDVVFTPAVYEGKNMLKTTVTYNGRSLSPVLVSSFNAGKPINRAMDHIVDPDFVTRLQSAGEIVSRGGGRIFLRNGLYSSTTFLVTLPLF